MSENLLDSCPKNFTLQNFQIEQVLGEGSYGFVLLAAHNKQEYALKEMSKYRLAKNHCEYMAFVEKELLKNVSHPGIITLHGAFQTHSKLYLVLEPCQGGQLQELIKKDLSQKQKRFYFAELVNIIEYIHSIGVVHRDLKPSNILITQKGHLKLVDFGSAYVDNCNVLSNAFKSSLSSMKMEKQEIQKHIEQHRRIRKRKSTFVGTIEYMSPQLIVKNECDLPSDLWALGCILYFIYYGRSPFSDPCQLTQFQKIKKGAYEFPKTQDVGIQVKDLISKLLVLTPEQRLGACKRQELTFKALKSHSFFKDLDVDNIFQCHPPGFVDPQQQIRQALIKLQGSKLNHSQSLLTVFLTRKVGNYNFVFRCQFLKNLIMKEFECEDQQKQPAIYKLSKIDNQDIAQELTPVKIKIKIQTNIGKNTLFYRTCNLRNICEQINDLYKIKQDQFCENSTIEQN